MKKTLFILAVAAATGLTLCSCVKKIDHSKSKQITKEISISEKFESINAFSTTDIEFVQGPAKFTLEAPETVIDQIEVKVVDGVLKVGKKDFRDCEMSFQSRLIVSYPYVSNFNTSGTGNISIKGIDVRDLDIVSSGTGNITLQTGKCVKLTTVSSGTGNIVMSHLSCVVANLTSSGTGNIDIERIVAERITANSSGTGDVKVSGECNGASLTATGTGRIDDRNLEIVKQDEE